MATAQDNGTDRRTDDAAVHFATHSASDRPQVETLELANRIVLRVRPVASFLLREAARSLPEPQPPKVWIESRGKNREDPNDPGWEENPDSPSYKQRRADWEAECEIAALKVALILGVTVESIPDGMHPAEVDDWIDEIETAAVASGTELPSVKREPEKARFLDWLRYYAIPSEEDIFRISRLALYGALVTEEELADALATFRSAKAWTARLATALAGGNINGALLPADDSGDSE